MHNDFVKRDLEQDEEEDQESEDERDSVSSKEEGSEGESVEPEVDFGQQGCADGGSEMENKEDLEKEDSDGGQDAEEAVEDTISTGLKSVRIDDSVKVLVFHSLPFCSFPCKG